ncbi:MAG TPA: hypothetical protein VNK49_10890 [Anaerolineales bacterium]|nr:hypothetical protein [Anaerolineales bacterium]
MSAVNQPVLELRVAVTTNDYERFIADGATLVHPPVMTPLGDYKVRQDPDGMQITLFQSAK